MGVSESTVVVERVTTPRGELVLRRRGRHYEIISNGVFLMATYNGDSERLLAEAALAAAGSPRRVLIGGLGVGFSLVAALAWPGVKRVTVVEVEPTVVGWHRSHLMGWSAGALDDPRVHVVEADLVSWLFDEAPRAGFDAVVVDIDNGPVWTVTPTNARLYGHAGLTALASALAVDGACAIWSASEEAAFAARLRHHFDRILTHRVPHPRGEPDVIYVACKGIPRP